MIRLSEIPSSHYMPVSELREIGMHSSELREAWIWGMLDRYESKKTRRVFYRSKNKSLI